MIVTVALAASACSFSRSAPDADAAASPGPTVALAIAVPTPVQVAEDRPAVVIRAATGSHDLLVYLHGRCDEPLSSIAGWSQAASAHGTLVALEGDDPCIGRDPSRRRWSPDIDQVHRRIEAAIRATAPLVPELQASSTVTLIGYSEGAARAEALLRQWPARYRRALLIGAPTAPSGESLAAADAVAEMAGSLDRQDLMKLGVANLRDAGVPVEFFELPGAEHGFFGPDGNRVMGEALSWLRAQHR